MRAVAATVACLLLPVAPASAGPPASSAGGQVTTAAHEPYRNRIVELTHALGPNAFELAEAWTALGFAQRQAHEHEQAVRSFENALHIERIHNGLHDPGQIALLELLADSNRALGDWSAVDRNYTLLAWVNERGRSADDPDKLRTLRELARWHLEASTLPTGRAPFGHLSTANELTEQALSLAEHRHGADAPALVDLLFLKAAVSYRIANHMSTWVGEPVLGVTQEAIVTSATMDTSDLIFRQNLIMTNYAAGREALLRALRITNRQGDVRRHARCEQLLGDWHLLFGRRQSAAEHYERAQMLADQAEIDLFSRPRRLPSFVDPEHSPAKAASPPSHYVRTRFDIDTQGRARNVQVLEVSPPERRMLARQARQQLREMRFRPRFRDGKAVRSEGVEIRIVFPQKRNAGGVAS